MSIDDEAAGHMLAAMNTEEQVQMVASASSDFDDDGRCDDTASSNGDGEPLRREPLAGAADNGPEPHLNDAGGAPIAAVDLETVTISITPLDAASMDDKRAAKQLLHANFAKNTGIVPLLEALLFRQVRGVLSNFFHSNKTLLGASADELRNLNLVLATREIDGARQLVGAAVVSKVEKSRHQPSLWAVVVMLFGVKKELRANGIGSKLFFEIMDWGAQLKAEERTAEDATARDESSHLMVLSAQPPDEAQNWWLRRLRQRSLEWNAYADSEHVQRQLGRPRLPEGLWAPWPIATSGVHVLAVDMAAVCQTSPVVDEATDDEAEETEVDAEAAAASAAAAAWSRRRKVFIEICCGSRRLSNAVALFQWHTLSVDDGSKKIPLEKPRRWDDQTMEAKLRVISPADVRPDLFSKCSDPTHFHVGGNFMDIHPDSWPTAAALHGSPNCASTSQMARNHHPRSEDNRFIAAADSSDLAKAWDGEVARFQQIVRNQRLRPDNEGLGFTFEQPMTVAARGHNYIQQMETPLAQGGDGAYRDEIDVCQMGAPVQKATDLWNSGLPGVHALLYDQAKGRHRFKCPGKSPKHNHKVVKGQTDKSVAFHPNLASLLAMGINTSYVA